MTQEISISEAEWKVLNVLWKQPGMLMGQIRTALSESGWSASTIKTLVLRLIKKGAVKTEESDGGRLYFPALNEEECRARETKSFIDRIYEGSVKSMFSNLVKESGLSEDEALELMKIIDKMEE